jgi:alkyldihydroxyacetonephosphate synthase
MSDAAATQVETRWWGWGDPGKHVELGPDAVDMLSSQLGPAQPAERVEIGEVGMPEARPLPESVVMAAGGSVLTSQEHRVRRAAGSSYPDLIRLRTGRLEEAPDAVVMPSGAEEVASILRACAEAGVAVVPYGGGTSVVGGVAAVRGGFDSVVSLDMHRMRHVEIDPVSMTARLGPGLRGPEAEQALAAEGFTLGHFPQSFEYATIGGFAATRSAGQASSGYGRFDALVTAIEMITPTGEMRTLATPHTAAGPALREVIVGSEGVLGVITDVTVRIRPAPQALRYEGWFAKSFGDAHEAVRALAQSEALPDVIRVSDERETAVSFGLAGTPGATRRALDAYLRLRGVSGGCLVICGWEGDQGEVERRRTRSARMLRGSGLVGLGAAPGRAWHRGRYDGPYLRDELLDRGYLVETLETAHTWSRLDELYRAVGGALSSSLDAAGTPGIVMCHLSHAYPDGASLYFTFIAPSRPGAEIEHWRGVKTAACEAIVSAGGTITHHHAIGRDHAPYMPAEVGDLGIGALRALKAQLDPAGIMNPGKLIPGAPA